MRGLFKEMRTSCAQTCAMSLFRPSLITKTKYKNKVIIIVDMKEKRCWDHKVYIKNINYICHHK